MWVEEYMQSLSKMVGMGAAHIGTLLYSSRKQDRHFLLDENYLAITAIVTVSSISSILPVETYGYTTAMLKLATAKLKICNLFGILDAMFLEFLL